jgi:hypothetical protein
MASLRDIGLMGNDTALKNRCLGAILSKARAVAADPLTHPVVAQFARSVCMSPDQYVTPLARVIAATPVVQDLIVVTGPDTGYSINSSAVTDEQIIAACEASWAAMAPVPPPES